MGDIIKKFNFGTVIVVGMAVLSALKTAGQDDKYTVSEMFEVVNTGVNASGIGDLVIFDGTESN